MEHQLDAFQSASGSLRGVWTIDIQTIPRDVNKILDAMVEVDPLDVGIYGRTATISAIGLETARPQAGSTTDKHVPDFTPGETETYTMVWIRVSIDRDLSLLEEVMDQVLEVHHYELPVVFVKEAWTSRSNYDPERDNPHRWWNDGLGLPDRVESIEQFFSSN